MNPDNETVTPPSASTSTPPSREVRRTIRKARALAEAGRWRKVILVIDSVDAAGDSSLVLQRLQAAIALDDTTEIGRCQTSITRMDNLDRRMRCASMLRNAGRPLEAAAILASLPPDHQSQLASIVAKNIRLTTRDRTALEQIQRFVPVATRSAPAPPLTVQRFPGDTDDYELPPSTLSIVRQEGVSPAIESYIHGLWERFAAQLDEKPYPTLREYRDVFVNENGQIWTADGSAVQDCGRPLPGMVDVAAVPAFDEVFSCVGRHKDYYEWIANRLPPLSWRLAPDTPDCTILLRKEQYGLAVDALGALGVPSDKLVVLEGIAFCRRLYLGSSSIQTLARPGAYQHSYGRLIDAAAANGAGGTPRRFYISRRDSARRSMTDEAGFEQAMIDRGFTPVLLSQLGLLDKINLFRNAEMVVGAHGAGFSHLVFARPGLRVIELMPTTMGNMAQMNVRSCFSMLSKAFGLDHTMILCHANATTWKWSPDLAVVDDACYRI